MRIAFISLMRGIPWGGSEDLWYKAARLAVGQGHSVCSVTQRWPETPPRIEELRQLGVQTLFYHTYPPTLPNRLAYKLKLRRALDYVPTVEADVYVISNGSTWDYLRLRRIAEQFTGAGKKYVLISQHSFENGDVVAAKDRAFALDVATRAARFYFVAQRNLEAAERQLAHRIPNAQTISNPLNTQGRAIKPWPEAAPLLLACVARLECEFKGQDLLLQALSGEPWASRDYRLRLYGAGKDRAHLQALIDLYGLGEQVSLEGQVSDVDQLWEANQAMVLPSLSEGTPLALMEAMMAGRPALATDVGDSGRYVRTGETGFLAATASVVCLRDGLEYLWRNRAQLRALGENAFRHTWAITDLRPEQTLLDFVETLDA